MAALSLRISVYVYVLHAMAEHNKRVTVCVCVLHRKITSGMDLTKRMPSLAPLILIRQSQK